MPSTRREGGCSGNGKVDEKERKGEKEERMSYALATRDVEKGSQQILVFRTHSLEIRKRKITSAPKGQHVQESWSHAWMRFRRRMECRTDRIDGHAERSVSGTDRILSLVQHAVDICSHSESSIHNP